MGRRGFITTRPDRPQTIILALAVASTNRKHARMAGLTIGSTRSNDRNCHEIWVQSPLIGMESSIPIRGGCCCQHQLHSRRSKSQ